MPSSWEAHAAANCSTSTIRANTAAFAGSGMPRVESRPDVLDLHLRAVVDTLGVLPAAGGRRPRVALDSCNGAGSHVTPRLIEALGADVVTIHTTPDGSFPRGAEPTPENLSALCDLVRSSGADVGFAQDMDADRLAIVSELGEPIGEELTLVLAVQRVLARTPGTVVTNLSTTHRLDIVAARRRVWRRADGRWRGERRGRHAAGARGHRR